VFSDGPSRGGLTKEDGTYIKGQRLRTVHILITVNPNKGVAAFVQRPLQADHNELEGVRRVRPNVVRDLRDVGVVQRSIDLVQNEERRWVETGVCWGLVMGSWA